MATTDTLGSAGYTLMESTGIWARSDYAGITYNDGDAHELALEAIVREAGDLSVFSRELADACTNWPSRYHLSSERANLLRPFTAHLSPGARVLEIGAGCGAVTRFLGETGADVLALEGSVRRAGIARLRTRDLPNVQVVAERFQDFSCGDRFDVITLVGVLEYASMFASEAQPALRMLEATRAMLKPDGRVLIAIENKLGLKYLAGVPEDHLGDPMAGVEDRYSDVGPRTFGRAELQRLLEEAGYRSARFLVPMPDYKMPTTILTETGATAIDFDAGALAAQCVRRDPQLPPVTSFNLQRAWPVVVGNGLAIDLANSFLVEATPLPFEALDADVLGYHYSTQRVRAFARETRFVRHGDDGIRVAARALGPDDDVGGWVRHRVESSSAYFRGKLLVEDLRAVLTSRDWTIDMLAAAFATYVQALRDILAAESRAMPLTHMDEQLPDSFLDATPSNLIRTDDGQVRYIDREWEVEAPSLGWLLIRGLMYSYSGTTVAAPAPNQASSLRDLIVRVLNEVGLACDTLSFDRYLADEVTFQAAVTGKDQVEAIHGMLSAALVAAPGVQGPQDWAEGFASLQHSLNLGAQHGINMYALLDGVHNIVKGVEARTEPALARIDADVTELSAGMAALHERLVVSNDRLNGAIEHWSVEQGALAQRVQTALENALAQDALHRLQTDVASLRDTQAALLVQLARPWWKRW